MTEPLLVVRDVYKSYHDGERELQVLRGAELAVAPGEAVAVVGMSGSGKSTLLHQLGGLDLPDRGSIQIAGQELGELSASERSRLRNSTLGFVFQFHHLLPEFSALENVCIPAMLAGKSMRESKPGAQALLEELGLGERLTHRPSRLSGGEQQRVALARALINGPGVLLADEPTGNLDKETGEAVIEMMWRLTVERNKGLVIVTHEPSIALRAGRILQLREGKLHPLDHHKLEEQLAVL